MACAVLDRNVENWRLTLYDRLNLPQLSGSSRWFLEEVEKERIAHRAWVISEEYKMKRRAERKKVRQLAKLAQKNQPVDYKPNPWLARFPPVLFVPD
jgi:hypothetical protein